jgi:hypothetical protein
MRRLLIIALVVVIALSVGCAKSTESSIQEINISNIKDVQFKNQLQEWEQKNGAYLLEYREKNDAYYLYLNAANVLSDSKRRYFESLTVDIENNILNIYYTEKEIDPSNATRNKILYKIPKAKSVDTVKIYQNGEETHFENIVILNNK